MFPNILQKSPNVKLMSNLYSNADLVIRWLIHNMFWVSQIPAQVNVSK